MAYIGREPQVGNFQVCDAISVVNGQAAYTMQVGGVNVSPETANHMLVSLNGVLQAPGSSYTVSGSTITFASNLVTGDVIDFIHILGSVLDLGVPSDGTVSGSKLAATAITGQTAETSIADDDLILISDTSASALRKMTKANFVSGVGGANTPAFEATLSSNFNPSSATETKVPFATETFDTDSAYDHSTNYRFTPQTAGKYLVYLWTRHNPSGTNNISNAYTHIKKNGSYAASFYTDNYDDSNVSSVGGSRVIEFNGSSDYVEAFIFQTTSSTPQIDQGAYTFFGAYKLIE